MLKGRDCFDYYDPIEENLFTSRGGEVTTQNRFSPIADFEYEYDKKEALQDKNIQDFYPAQDKKTLRKVCFRDQEEFIMNVNDYEFCSICGNIPQCEL